MLAAASGRCQAMLPVFGHQVKRLGHKLSFFEKALELIARTIKGRAAETANVAEAQLVSTSVQAEGYVRVGRRPLMCRPDGQLSGHAQVNHQMKISVKVENNPFASAAHPHDPITDQQSFPALLPLLPQTLAADPDCCNAPVNQVWSQLSNDGFNFW